MCRLTRVTLHGRARQAQMRVVYVDFPDRPIISQITPFFAFICEAPCCQLALSLSIVRMRNNEDGYFKRELRICIKLCSLWLLHNSFEGRKCRALTRHIHCTAAATLVSALQPAITLKLLPPRVSPHVHQALVFFDSCWTQEHRERYTSAQMDAIIEVMPMLVRVQVCTLSLCNTFIAIAIIWTGDV
eukprot:6199344-Pleurochrysis_carterae.AAC.1